MILIAPWHAGCSSRKRSASLCRTIYSSTVGCPGAKGGRCATLASGRGACSHQNDGDGRDPKLPHMPGTTWFAEVTEEADAAISPAAAVAAIADQRSSSACQQSRRDPEERRPLAAAGAVAGQGAMEQSRATTTRSARTMRTCVHVSNFASRQRLHWLLLVGH